MKKRDSGQHEKTPDTGSEYSTSPLSPRSGKRRNTTARARSPLARCRLDGVAASLDYALRMPCSPAEERGAVAPGAVDRPTIIGSRAERVIAIIAAFGSVSALSRTRLQGAGGIFACRCSGFFHA